MSAARTLYAYEFYLFYCIDYKKIMATAAAVRATTTFFPNALKFALQFIAYFLAYNNNKNKWQNNATLLLFLFSFFLFLDSMACKAPQSPAKGLLKSPWNMQNYFISFVLCLLCGSLHCFCFVILLGAALQVWLLFLLSFCVLCLSPVCHLKCILNVSLLPKQWLFHANWLLFFYAQGFALRLF